MNLNKLHDVIKIQGSDGNWDFDPYHHGMYNGLELARSIVEEDSDPVFLAAPDTWRSKDRDEELRRSSPVLQRAWDEYILLKTLIEEAE